MGWGYKMPRWNVHRKWAKIWLGLFYHGGIRRDIDELIDFPEKQGWYIGSHDWRKLWQQEILRAEACRRYGQIGLLLVDLHGSLDYLAERSNPAKRAQSDAFNKTAQGLRGTYGTEFNPHTGRMAPRIAMEIGRRMKRVGSSQRSDVSTEKIEEEYIRKAMEFRVNKEVIKFIITNLPSILHDIELDRHK